MGKLPLHSLIDGGNPSICFYVMYYGIICRCDMIGDMWNRAFIEIFEKMHVSKSGQSQWVRTLSSLIIA